MPVVVARWLELSWQLHLALLHNLCPPLSEVQHHTTQTATPEKLCGSKQP